MTSTALSIYTPQQQVELAAEVWPLANRLAETEFVPKALRGRPEAVMACMLKGTELGIPLMQSLSSIHVIEGRPTMSAELMRAVVQSRGHTIVVEDSTSTRCIVKGRRLGDDDWQRFTFTRDDAERAGVLGKEVWKKWPAAMLLARASSLMCRAIFADCLAGISYTLEELNDGTDTITPDVATIIEAELADPDAPPAPRKTTRRTSRTRPARSSGEPPAEPPPARDLPPLPGEPGYAELLSETPPAASRTVDQDIPRPGPVQIAIALKDHGVDNSADRARAVRQLVRRPIESSKDLTADEIALVLTTLTDLGAGVAFPFIEGADPDPPPDPNPEGDQP